MAFTMGEGSFLAFVTFKESLNGAKSHSETSPSLLHDEKGEEGHELTDYK